MARRRRADERDQRADQRDQQADQRDERAELRALTADTRDQQADQREEHADRREEALGRRERDLMSQMSRRPVQCLGCGAEGSEIAQAVAAGRDCPVCGLAAETLRLHLRLPPD